MDMQKLKTKLAKARTSLILEHPFIGTIALNMPMELDDSVPTAATNGKWVKFNPAFIDPLTDDQMKFLVAHEVFHPMLEHMWRLKGRDRDKWNRAGDFVINQLLVDEKIGTFIDGGCLDKTIYTNGKGTTDGIYNILPDSPSGGGKGGGNDGSGGIGPDLVDPGGSPAEQAAAEAEMRVKVAQAAQAAKMMGKLSANMARIAGEILQPKVDWRDVLRRFVHKAKNDTRSWARPNRRFAAQGLYLPTVSGEAMGEIAIAVDCSGSIDERTLNEFAAEMRAIKEDVNPLKVHVIYFDSEVCHYDKFERDEALHVQPHGGGGTAFSPVMRYIENNGIEPVCCVFLTDLYCSDFGPPPGYPVLFVSNGDDKAPWGEVVKM